MSQRPANVEEAVRVEVEEDGEELTVGKAVESGQVRLSQGADVVLLEENWMKLRKVDENG